MPTLDFLIGLISTGKKDYAVYACVCVCVCVCVTHTKVITVKGTDLHWFDTLSIFPFLSFQLMSALPLISFPLISFPAISFLLPLILASPTSKQVPFQDQNTLKHNTM